MKRKIDVSVSLDPVSGFQNPIDYAKSLQGYADFLHCDVMDGKFVEKTTFDHEFVKTLNSQTLLPLDVHLMCDEPFDNIDKYISAGANIITVHYEAFKDKGKLINVFKKIREGKALAGLSFKPKTKVQEIKSFLFYVDLVLVMSVEPGMSGQNFMPESIEKVKQLNDLRDGDNLAFKIEVDGGIDDKNAHLICEMGADILVSGSYIYKSVSREKAIKKLKNSLKLQKK